MGDSSGADLAAPLAGLHLIQVHGPEHRGKLESVRFEPDRTRHDPGVHAPPDPTVDERA
jgi:hypothetical protein